MKKEALIKVSAVLIVLSIAVFALFLNAPFIQADICYAKACEMGGKDCACCLRTSGTIMCAPCGAYDCPPDP